MIRLSYRISGSLFLRFLGLIYAIGFASLWTQIEGLIGSQGILPFQEFLTGVSSQIGRERYWLLPTVFWLFRSDISLQIVCALGMGLGLLATAGVFFAPIQIALWALYLSLTTVCHVFLGFQWDNLLLEAGFLSFFLTSFRPQFGSRNLPPPSKYVVFAFRFLFFKLMFMSGIVKLASGDAAWRNFTALNYHYETQPLPNWMSWYAHQLPEWFQKISVAGTLSIELMVPFFIFLNQYFRKAAFGAFISLQFLIMVTGNYCFFNWLTIALSFFLLRDDSWPKIFDAHLSKTERLHRDERDSQVLKQKDSWFAIPFVAFFILVSSGQVLKSAGIPQSVLWPLSMMERALQPLRSVNRYGLFAVMTTTRPEIVIEGSRDGKAWKAYEFKWKVQDVNKKPDFVAPYQPRLDWQMWFAALGSYQRNPWFMNFTVRLLEGSPEVLKLLHFNPFPEDPPKFIRAVFYEYRFTDFKTRAETGAWWKRKRKGLYMPSISLK
jgi:lipase maturation factor 1